MRLLGSLSFCAALLSTLLMPDRAMALTAHSWCITGDPITADSFTDPDAKAIVGNICGQSAFARCCNTDTTKKGRWDLSCVQAGVIYASAAGMGDVCGRLMWAQGPIAGTEQYYPRDFTLFTLNGDVASLQDAEGPVAAQGNITMSNFNMNWGKHGAVGLVANGNLTLSSGTITGASYYGGTYKGSSVTATPAPAQKKPIDFGTAATNLGTMSQTIKAFTPQIAASKNYSTLTLTGTDPELNVFSINADSGTLSGVYSYVIDVPHGASAIINVTGTKQKAIQILNAGFDVRNGVLSSKILWNFPDATSLLIQSVKFVGSILAPQATAQLRWGQLHGTAVVKAATGYDWFELHWAPFQIDSCCGCLCRDTTWSCSTSTCVDDKGNALAVRAEAGFFEIPSGQYYSPDTAKTGVPQTSTQRTSPTNRIWYSFQPAAGPPESKPLAVLFNGGPGTATSSRLFSFNTGPYTLDPDPARAGDPRDLVSNAYSWTQFANLLYIDAPGTGFSYPVKVANNGPSVGIDLDADAAAVLRVVVRFLARHPSLQRNRVILVGESYGGTRATLMLEHVLAYQDLPDVPGSKKPFRDSNLYNELVKHFSAVFPGQTVWAPDLIATQFSHQVLIQPAVAGNMQWSRNLTNTGRTGDLGVRPAGYDSNPTCLANYDDLECDEPSVWEKDTLQKVSDRLATVATLGQALGVDPTTIDWLFAAARGQAYARDTLNNMRGNADRVINNGKSMNDTFGTLVGGDNYFLADNSQVLAAYDSNARGWLDNPIGASFLQNVVYVNTFITNARLDIRVYTPAIEAAFHDDYFMKDSPDGTKKAIVSSSVWDQTPRSDARTGWIQLVYQPGIATPSNREIRFPYYANAGHTVSMHGFAELLADVEQWYSIQPQAMYSLQMGFTAVTPPVRQTYPATVLPEGPPPRLDF